MAKLRAIKAANARARKAMGVRAPRRHKRGGAMIGGLYGGLLEEDPAEMVRRYQAEKNVLRRARIAEGNYGPPFDKIFKGRDKLSVKQLEELARAMEGMTVAPQIMDWRQKIRKREEALDALPEKLARQLGLLEEKRP